MPRSGHSIRGCGLATQIDRARGRIVVISATVGAGHDAATRELAGRLRARGFDVDCHDFMGMLPMKLGPRAVDGHQKVLRRAPWFYGVLFGIGNRFRMTPPLTRLLLLPARRRVRGAIGDDALAVVSTYPLASQVLGQLRRRGWLAAPAITYSTDFAPHRHWVAPGMDADLSAHPVCADQARGYGAKRAIAAGAMVRSRFRPPSAAAKAAARVHYGLPATGALALVACGSWGVGEIEAAASDISRTGLATPVVICGHNDALRQRLRSRGIRYALGWVDDMASLMQAVDLLVENAGGIMALEGMACGLPVLTYRPIPGHGHENAATLQRAGVSTWVRRRRDLAAALVAVTQGAGGQRQAGNARVMFDRDAAALVSELALNSVPRPSPAPRPAPPAPGFLPARPVAVGEGRRRGVAVASVAAVFVLAVLRTRRRRMPIG